MSVMKEWKVGIDLIFKQPLTASIVAIVASFLKLVCSIVLFHGIRKNKHILFLPWLAEETIELVFGTVLFFMETIQRQWLVNSRLFLVLIIISYYTRDVTGATFFLIVNIIGGYFLYSTASYYNILRRRNINSSIVVQSVSQGTTYTGLIEMQ